jgi:signal transduction histidine kinase
MREDGLDDHAGSRPGWAAAAVWGTAQLGRLTPGVPQAATITAITLTVGTLVFVWIPRLHFAAYAPQLDIALTTVAAVVSIAVAGLSFARYREQGGGEGLLEASAFLILAIASFANVVAIISGTDVAFGLRIDEPGQLPLYVWAVVRLVSAGLLAAGAVPLIATRFEGHQHARLVLWLPTILVVAGCAVLWVFRDSIPVLIDPATLRRLADESFSTAPLPGVNVGILLLDGAAALLLVMAALGYSHTSHRTAGVPRTYLVVALVVATFSQVHLVLFPAVYTGLVSTGDALRIAFFLILFAGINAGTRTDLQTLRTANGRLQLLAAAEADRTAIAERARLARELHDGLAQDLWRTKLEYERLVAQLDHVDLATVDQLVRVRDALDAARREAGAAVGALRSGFDAGLSLTDELPRRLDAFVDRTGFRVDLDLDPSTGRLPGVLAAEVLRIIDESMHNVQKHADATRILVRVAVEDEVLQVTIVDNGRGFNPTATSSGHGLVGMRERAILLGGGLDVRSAPGDGTTIVLSVPVTELPR